MTTSLAANKASSKPWQACGAAGWIALGASPTFALMAWIGAHDAAPHALCAAGSAILPIDDMTTMYLLMSVFHLSPWLKRASGRPWARSYPITQGD
jgi:hypothetical protein